MAANFGRCRVSTFTNVRSYVCNSLAATNTRKHAQNVVTGAGVDLAQNYRVQTSCFEKKKKEKNFFVVVLLCCYYAVFRYSFGLYCVQICFVVVCTSRMFLGDFKAISARFWFFRGILVYVNVHVIRVYVCICVCTCAKSGKPIYACTCNSVILITRMCVIFGFLFRVCTCIKGIFYRVCVKSEYLLRVHTHVQKDVAILRARVK